MLCRSTIDRWACCPLNYCSTEQYTILVPDIPAQYKESSEICPSNLWPSPLHWLQTPIKRLFVMVTLLICLSSAIPPPYIRMQQVNLVWMGSQKTLMLVIILLLHEECSSMSVGSSAIDAEVTIHPLVGMCVYCKYAWAFVWPYI